MAKMLVGFVFAFMFSFSALAADGPGRERISGRDRYIAGGIVGTVVGLGIGHAIQQRYMDKGLMFTLTESVSIALIVVGAAVPMPRAASIPLIVVGALGLSAFKIWEIIDVWTGPMADYAIYLPGLERQNRLSLANPSTQIGLSFKF